MAQVAINTSFGHFIEEADDDDNTTEDNGH